MSKNNYPFARVLYEYYRVLYDVLVLVGVATPGGWGDESPVQNTSGTSPRKVAIFKDFSLDIGRFLEFPIFSQKKLAKSEEKSKFRSRLPSTGGTDSVTFT